MDAPRARVVRATVLVVAVIGAIALLGRGVGGGAGDGEMVVLDVPPAGGATAAELPDGTPVFVTHEADGDVHVVEAVNPHRFWGLTTLVGWCPPAGGFEQSLDGSRFDAAGRYLSGPAGSDLASFATTRSADTVLVGERREPEGRSPTGDPAVRQWCGGTAVTLDSGGDVVALDAPVAEFVTHTPDATAELLAVPGQPIQWCDGIVATLPPRCARRVATLHTPDMEDELPWSWKGPVRRDPDDPESLLLLSGGREEYPARGTLTRVFGRVRRLSTVADTLRLVVNRKIVFGDFFTAPRPLELGEPVPRPWRIGDQDGPVQSTFTLTGATEEEARDYVGELVDMVVASNSRILHIELLPGAPG